MGQIGTIKLQTQNNGTVSVPVFATGDSGSSVHEFLRVQTAGGTGFIPLVAPSDASYPYLRVQSQNHGVVAAHNESSLIQIVDDYEDNDIAEYSGDTGSYSTVTSPVQHGSYALQGTTTSDATDISIASTTGLDNYPSSGDTFRFWLRLDGMRSSDSSGVRTDTMFAAQSETSLPDGYMIHTEGDFGGHSEFALVKRDGGSESELAGTSFSWANDTWYDVEVQWGSSGGITVTLYDSSGSQLAQISGSDSTFGSGGIGFVIRIDTNITSQGWLYNDYYRIP